ncbi:hypothetical protein EBU99_09095 [bacterium]|nr:hypothetical protein [bacterium]
MLLSSFGVPKKAMGTLGMFWLGTREFFKIIRHLVTCIVALVTFWVLAANAEENLVPNAPIVHFAFIESLIEKPSAPPRNINWQPFAVNTDSLAPQKEKSLWMRERVPAHNGQSKLTL